jgi:hypothetical protein
MTLRIRIKKRIVDTFFFPLYSGSRRRSSHDSGRPQNFRAQESWTLKVAARHVREHHSPEVAGTQVNY